MTQPAPDARPFGLSVKALIRDAAGNCLVIRRSRDSNFWAGSWDLPGGKLDPGESFDDALLREAREEVGLDIKLTRFLGALEWPLPHVHVVFLLMEATAASVEIFLSDEHEEVRWVSVLQLRELALVDPIAQIVQALPNLT